MLKTTLLEMARLQRIKKEEELLANPKTKMLGMMLKAKRLRDEQKDQEEQKDDAAAEEKTEEDKQQEPEKATLAANGNSGVTYNPKRQDFCMIYVLTKL